MIRSFHFSTGRFPSYRDLIKYTTIQSPFTIQKIVKMLARESILTIARNGKITAITYPDHMYYSKCNHAKEEQQET